MADNKLFFGDNLKILDSGYIDDESVDLIYLDPPFQSGRNYNVIFEERNGSAATAQIKAFEDTWTWDESAARLYHDTVEEGGAVSETVQAFHDKLLGTNDLMAYLANMAPRLKRLHRVLKPTGSLYLHCDPTASHYLKLLLDAVFGPKNFLSEIIWQRTTNTGSSKARANRFPTDHDTLLFYAKDRGNHKFHTQYRPYSEEYIEHYYTHDDGDGRGRYQLQALATVSDERLKKLREEDRIVEGKGKYLRYKDYLKDKKGVPVNDIWTDIYPVNPASDEKIGYETQKPEALLERVIKASSDEGDLVLDPFCGGGTTPVMAEKLDRQWIGIDITYQAIGATKRRLQDTFDGKADYGIVGEPTTLPDARALAKHDRHQFELWALDLVDARPNEKKKGADKGIDGRQYIHDPTSDETFQIIYSVKSGNVGVGVIRKLDSVVKREKADLGVLITLQEPTKPMTNEAADGGIWDSPWEKYPRLQILTVEELLEGARVKRPYITGADRTFRQAPRHTPTSSDQQAKLDLSAAEGG